jgi:hypothetical protein
MANVRVEALQFADGSTYRGTCVRVLATSCGSLTLTRTTGQVLGQGKGAAPHGYGSMQAKGFEMLGYFIAGKACGWWLSACGAWVGWVGVKEAGSER